MKIWKINSFFKKSAYCEGISCYRCKFMIRCMKEKKEIKNHNKTVELHIKDLKNNDINKYNLF